MRFAAFLLFFVIASVQCYKIILYNDQSTDLTVCVSPIYVWTPKHIWIPRMKSWSNNQIDNEIRPFMASCDLADACYIAMHNLCRSDTAVTTLKRPWSFLRKRGTALQRGQCPNSESTPQSSSLTSIYSRTSVHRIHRWWIMARSCLTNSRSPHHLPRLSQEDT